MQTVTVQTTQNIDIDYEVAGLGDRILARLIDIGFFIAFAIVLILIAAATSFDKIFLITFAVIFFFLYATYDLLSEVFFNGQSFGKRLMKIKVVSLNGARPSVSQYLLRWLFRIVDFTITYGVCALISVAVSQKKQRVGDMVAGTTLIKTHPRTTMNSIAFMPQVDSYTPIFSEATNLTSEQIILMNEVVTDYEKTGNSVLTYNMALQIKLNLGVNIPPEMSDHQFLKTLIKDHDHVAVVQQVYQPIFTNVAQLTDSDVSLIHEVLVNYAKTHNVQLLTNMGDRIKEHLQITVPDGMGAHTFLTTIVKDYNYITAGMSV